MRNDLQDQRMIDGNKSIDRVVDDLADGVHFLIFGKARTGKENKSTLPAMKKLTYTVAGLHSGQVLTRKKGNASRQVEPWL